MNDIFKYINKYGNLTFEEKSVTDVDILVFSQISYLNYSNAFISDKDEIKLSVVWKKTREYNVKPAGLAPKKAFKIMEVLWTKKRYKDLLLKNYVYYVAEDTQFGAITIKVPNEHIYVVFEGTDDTLCGWKEDFKLAYVYPTESQKMAAKYLNDTINIFGPDVIVCGHSKGGNLALVGAMNTKFFKKNKIKKIYSFDGPGLKDEEFSSLNYKFIKNKLINIIPNGSLVGVLLNQENVTVIKSKGIGILQHQTTTWVINDDKFEPAVQDKLSKKLDISISRWLAKYDYKKREEIIESIFGVFENANIKKLSDIKMNNLESLYKIIKSSKKMSFETKEVIRTSIKLLATDFGTEIMNESQKLKNNLGDIFNDITKK